MLELKRPTEKWAMERQCLVPKRPPEESAPELRDSVKTDTGEHIDVDLLIKIKNDTAWDTAGPIDATEGPEDADMGSPNLAPMTERQRD